jgi:uncharacterized protein YidB (DUF937 family)
MQRSHPSSGRPATPADISRNGRPTSIGTGGRHQSECPADIIGIRSSSTSVPEALVAALASHEGGLGGLVQKFEGAGLGSVISTWIGSGENQPAAPDALHGILGSDLVQQISAKTGLPVDQLLPQIAQHLPGVVDGMTPDGKLPSAGNLLDAGLAFLKSAATKQS